MGTPIAATTDEQWTPYFSVDVIAGVTLHSHLSPVLRTIVVYDTRTIVCITPKLVHNWLPYDTRRFYVVYWHPTLRCHAVWTITDPGHADRTRHCALAGVRRKDQVESS